MADASVNVPVGKLLSEHMTVRVTATGATFAIVRLRLAMPLLWLGAKVAGVGFDIDLDRR